MRLERLYGGLMTSENNRGSILDIVLFFIQLDLILMSTS